MKVDARPPFEAYRGSDPYIFISYSHRDAAAVFAELLRLSSWGLNIWYDEGIDPGNEWPKEIAAAIGKASLFLFFVSPQSVASVNCRNEVYYALSLKKPFLCIHLEPTQIQDIDAGLALSIGTLQAVLKHAMEEGQYEAKLRRAFELLSESKTISPVVPMPAPTVGPARAKASSSSTAILVGAGLVAALVGCGIGAVFYLNHKPDVQSVAQTQTAQSTQSSTPLLDMAEKLNATPAPTAKPDASANVAAPEASIGTGLTPATTPAPDTTEASPIGLAPAPRGPLGIIQKLRELREQRQNSQNSYNSTNDAPLSPPPPVFGH